MHININKLLTKASTRVISFQPKVEPPTPALPSILPGVTKVPVLFPSDLFFLCVFLLLVVLSCLAVMAPKKDLIAFKANEATLVAQVAERRKRLVAIIVED